MKWVRIVFPLILIALCMILLYVPSPVGLSDNGDFLRTTQPNFIESISQDNQKYVFHNEYKMNLDKPSNLIFYDSGSVDYFSPQFIIITTSKILNYFYHLITLGNIEQYSLFFLAFLHILILAFAFYLFLDFLKDKKLWLQITFAVLYIFIFCDMGYILYFNSFYAEGFQFVLALLIVSLCLKLPSVNKKRWMILYYIVLILFSGAKYANIPIALVFAAVPIFINKKRRKYATVLFVLSSVIIVSYFSFVPVWMNKVTTYHSVFYGILKNSPSVAQDLKDLKLPDEYAVLANTNSYLDEYGIDIHGDAFDQQFYQKFSKVDVLKFYITHPNRLIQKLNITAKNTAFIRPPYLSNYTADHERMTFCNRFSIWENTRRWLQLDNLAMIFLVLLLFVSMIFKTKGSNTPLFIALFLATIGAFVLPILGNGEADLAKHTFAFIHFFDFCILFLILYFLQKPWKKVLTAGLVCVIIFTVFYIPVSFAKVYESPKKGSMVQFGEMVWMVTDADNEKLLLVANESVANMPFDTSEKYGSNLWETSTLRSWLNIEFYNQFSENEKAKIIKMPQKELLSDENNAMRDGGYHPFYWEFVPSTFGFDSAYFKWSEDAIFLPDIKQHIGKANEAYWLKMPLATSNSMVRTVEKNGYILHRDANTLHAVHPAVYIKASQVQGGNGTVKNPFIIK